MTKASVTLFVANQCVLLALQIIKEAFQMVESRAVCYFVSVSRRFLSPLLRRSPSHLVLACTPHNLLVTHHFELWQVFVALEPFVNVFIFINAFATRHLLRHVCQLGHSYFFLGKTRKIIFTTIYIGKYFLPQVSQFGFFTFFKTDAHS